MNMFAWLGLGFVAYACGFGIRHFWYDKKDVPKDKFWLYMGIFVLAAIAVFSYLNFYVLHKTNFDIAFVGVSSLVATGVFYYGISTDTSKTMKIPD